jgi:hypothetical protein
MIRDGWWRAPRGVSGPGPESRGAALKDLGGQRPPRRRLPATRSLLIPFGSSIPGWRAGRTSAAAWSPLPGIASPELSRLPSRRPLSRLLAGRRRRLIVRSPGRGGERMMHPSCGSIRWIPPAGRSRRADLDRASSSSTLRTAREPPPESLGGNRNIWVEICAGGRRWARQPPGRRDARRSGALRLSPRSLLQAAELRLGVAPRPGASARPPRKRRGVS